MLARDAVIKKDYAAAEKQLHWVLDHSDIASMRQIARLRLARIAIAANKPQDAIDLLRKLMIKVSMVLTDEVKGMLILR